MKLSVPMDMMELSPSILGTQSAQHRAVLVLSDSDAAHIAARRFLEPNGWDVHSALDPKQALARMRAAMPAVLLCEDRLSSARWTSLLDAIVQLPAPPRIVVFSRLADHVLWGEVLNLGAYDLLTFPFDRDELLRVTALAAGSWELELRQRPRSRSAERVLLANSA